MRYLLILVCLVMVGAQVQAIEANFVMPNAEATWYYDFSSKASVLGASSKFAYIGDFDVRLGYYTDVTSLGIAYDLKNLNKLGVKVGYAWGDSWKLTIGTGVGINFNTNKISGNLMSVLLQIGLN